MDVDDPEADAAEVRLLRQEGNKVLAMLPLVAKGQAIGLVELFSRTAITFDAERLQLARTMANEAAMALENARLYMDARNLADRDPLTGFYQPPLPARAARRGSRRAPSAGDGRSAC